MPGVYLGAGSIKTLASCYIGNSGVKTVKSIYVGVGGSPKLVWPATLDLMDTSKMDLNLYYCSVSTSSASRIISTNNYRYSWTITYNGTVFWWSTSIQIDVTPYRYLVWSITIDSSSTSWGGHSSFGSSAMNSNIILDDHYTSVTGTSGVTDRTYVANLSNCNYTGYVKCGGGSNGANATHTVTLTADYLCNDISGLSYTAISTPT